MYIIMSYLGLTKYRAAKLTFVNWVTTEALSRDYRNTFMSYPVFYTLFFTLKDEKK